MKRQFIETGRIVGTHGIKGEMRVQPWCDSPDFLTQFKTLYLDDFGKTSIKITFSRAHGNICLIKVKGVDTIEAAEALRGKILFIDRKDCKLEEGRYFVDDIIGCSVYDTESNFLYGIVSDVSQTGANDVWHITSDGKEYLLPNIPQFVKFVDINNEIIKITPPKGIFDDEN